MRQQHDRDSMSSDKASKTNRGSDILTKDENEAVFSMLGRKCQAQCTGVIQLFTTGAPAHSHWIKRHAGALCFVKDSSKRSYFCRIYCLMRGEMVWEQEMYDSVDLVKSRSFLLTFEGQDGMVAFNFASDDEANVFYNVARTTMANRNRRREERYRRSNNRRDPPSRPPPATSSNVLQNSNSNNKQDAIDSTVTLRNPQKQFVQTPMLQQVPAVFPSIGGGGRQAKRGNRKLTKADISMPSDFKHVTHVGWNPTSGFDFTGEENDALQPFLAKAGVSDQQLKDRETREFIYDFIQNHNVLESVKSDNSNPPPVPTRSQNSSSGSSTGQRQAPPPPPTRQPGPPPLPKTGPPPAVRAPAPSRPPPIVTTPNRTGGTAAAVAPPPPPPPPPMMPAAPPPPPASGMPPPIAKPAAADDPRTALMDSIRKGAQLKKIDPANESTGSGGSGDVRQDLMSEIRQGRELRPASIRELGAKVEVPHTDALAAALREALANRGRVIQSSDDDSTDSENDGEWDD